MSFLVWILKIVTPVNIVLKMKIEYCDICSKDFVIESDICIHSSRAFDMKSVQKTVFKHVKQNF